MLKEFAGKPLEVPIDSPLMTPARAAHWLATFRQPMLPGPQPPEHDDEDDEEDGYYWQYPVHHSCGHSGFFFSHPDTREKFQTYCESYPCVRCHSLEFVETIERLEGIAKRGGYDVTAPVPYS